MRSLTRRESAQAALLLTVVLCVAGSEEQDQTCSWKGSYFPDIPSIPYEGPDSANPLAFHYYNASEVVMGKPMKEWLRFSVAFWHSFRGDGSDPFGAPTRRWPWEDASLDEMEMAVRRMEANFEFMTKLGVEFWCFHDRDIAPEGKDLEETNANLDKIAEVAEKLQKKTGIQLLWGTAQLFKHPRFMHGAATSPHADVFAFAAAQVKKCMEVTKRLGGQGYNFWGGREGYHTLRNTNMKLELDNLAIFMKMAADYKKKIGFTGQLLIEPKPQEPTKHQYDFDAASTTAFLLNYGLRDDFKLVIECNHATLAGHSCEHEMVYASQYGFLGSIDINTGDPQTGWDTDQFLTDVTEATLIMNAVLKQGTATFSKAAVRGLLQSIDVEDLFYAHISSMDALARGLRNAAKMIEDKTIDQAVQQRYASYSSGIGLLISKSAVGFEELETYAISRGDPVSALKSGQAEKYDMMLSHYIR